MFPGVKAVGAQGWQTYHLLVPTVLESESLYFLEPLESVQACNGIVLPFTFTFIFNKHDSKHIYVFT